MNIDENNLTIAEEPVFEKIKIANEVLHSHYSLSNSNRINPNFSTALTNSKSNTENTPVHIGDSISLHQANAKIKKNNISI